MQITDYNYRSHICLAQCENANEMIRENYSYLPQAHCNLPIVESCGGNISQFLFFF